MLVLQCNAAAASDSCGTWGRLLGNTLMLDEQLPIGTFPSKALREPGRDGGAIRTGPGGAVDWPRMADTLSPTQRSERMRRVRGKDTKPEMVVRRLVHGLGYRYRLHVGSLPGRPDLVFPGARKAVFVNGCFWHRHEGCPHSRTPKTRIDFWTNKFEENVARDQRNLEALRQQGWDVLVVWECEVKDTARLTNEIHKFMGAGA